MKPYIEKEKCAAQPDICPPMKACKANAFSYIEDDDELMGGRIEIDLDKCNECGKCVDLCCGSCIILK